jgi:cobalamin biosynthesis protein CobT
MADEDPLAEDDWGNVEEVGSDGDNDDDNDMDDSSEEDSDEEDSDNDDDDDDDNTSSVGVRAYPRKSDKSLSVCLFVCLSVCLFDRVGCRKVSMGFLRERDFSRDQPCETRLLARLKSRMVSENSLCDATFKTNI